MSDFASEYERLVLEGMKPLFESMKKRDAVVDRIAQADIAAGKNLCTWKGHDPRPTMQMVYPSGKWICEECRNFLFAKGILGNGVAVFDMSDRPEGWKP